MDVSREQVMRFRLATQVLAEPSPDALDVAAGWGVQDSPPGSAPLALLARLQDLGPAEYERLVERDRELLSTYNARTAVAVVPSRQAAAFLAALTPDDEVALAALVEPALPDGGIAPREAAERVSAATREALDGRVLSRDELHAHLRAVLPKPMLPWCEGCQSHHVRRWLLVWAALDGVLCLAGRRGRQAAFARPDQWLGSPLEIVDPGAARAELVRRYLHGWGPSTPAALAQWAGVTRAQADRAWATVAAELVEVRTGAGPSWALTSDASAIAAPPEADAVRLLPPGDPFLQARDRELLVPEAAQRKAIWTALGAPGVVMAGGAVAGIWRPRKQGKRLAVTVEPFRSITRAARSAIEEQAERIAPLRGCATAEVAYTP